MPLSRETSLYADLKAVFFIGLALLIVGSVAVFDRNPGAGFLSVAGSILIAAAVVGNSLSSTPKEPEDGDGD